jgi:hypothetical protein
MRGAFVVQSVVAALGIVSVGSAAVAAEYRFTQIAEVEPLQWGTRPAINASGQVAFRGVVGGVEGIYLGSGGPLRTIAQAGGEFQQFNANPAVNDAGEVVFVALGTLPRQVLQVGNGVTTRTIFDSTGPVASLDYFGGTSTGSRIFYGTVGIDNRGVVTFRGATHDGDHGIFRHEANDLRFLVSERGGRYDFIGEPQANEQGDFVFLTRKGTLGSVLVSGAALDRGTDDLHDFYSDSPLLNNVGHVLFSKGSFAHDVFIAADGATRRLSAIKDFVAFNDRDEVLTRGPGDGLYVAGGSSFDAVIRVGDPLFGSTVLDASNLRAGRESLGDTGEVAFYTALADGRYVIGRAEPVPEPTMPCLALGLGVALGLGALLARRRR